MNEIKQTKSSLSRHAFIWKKIANSKEDKCCNQRSHLPKQECSNKIKNLKNQVADAEKELESIETNLTNLHHAIPKKLKHFEKSCAKEIHAKDSYLSRLEEERDRNLDELHALEEKETNLLVKIREYEEYAAKEDKFGKYSYQLFKKGQFAGYLETEDSMQSEPCHMVEIERILDDIRETELELLKWQNIDCQNAGPPQREISSKEEDSKQYLIRFIMDGLMYYILDGDKNKEIHLNRLVSLFDFNEEELSLIKSRKK